MFMKRRRFVAALLCTIGAFLCMTTMARATSGTLTVSGSPYEFNGLNIPRDSTLTVEPGVEIRIAGASAISVQGTLNAAGTAQLPIVFTGKEATAKDAWNAIVFEGGSSGKLSYAKIFYAGNWEDAAIVCKGNAAPTIDNCDIAHIGGSGIVTYDMVSPIFSPNNTLSELQGLGAKNQGTGTINAKNIWWGSATGPKHASLNPNGTGFEVTVSPHPMSLPVPWRSKAKIRSAPGSSVPTRRISAP